MLCVPPPLAKVLLITDEPCEGRMSISHSVPTFHIVARDPSRSGITALCGIQGPGP